MIADKKILAIIPARGGSKGLPDKNIKVINGKPMIAHSIEKAFAVPGIDRLIVSTDDENIAKVAREYGVEVPFLRNPQLARSDTPMTPVIIDAVQKVQNENGPYDYALMLQANSPLTRVQDISAVMHKIISCKLDVVFTVSEATHPPQWTLRIDEGAPKFAFLDEKVNIGERRQDQETLYRSTGAVYSVYIPYLLNNKVGARLCLPAPNQKTGVIVSDIYSSIDIDNELDFYLTETIINQKMI